MVIIVVWERVGQVLQALVHDDETWQLKPDLQNTQGQELIDFKEHLRPARVCRIMNP